MSRLPAIPASTYTGEQQALFDSITGGDRARLRPPEEFLNEEGGLAGPFGPWIYSPVLGDRAQALGATVRFQNRLDPQLRELAICVVAAHTKAEYEWWAHAKIAHEEGMDANIIQSLQDGTRPQFDDDAMAAVYDVARELMTRSTVTDATFVAARKHIDDASLVDLVITVGYYNLVALSLNTFDIPLPDGVSPSFR